MPTPTPPPAPLPPAPLPPAPHLTVSGPTRYTLRAIEPPTEAEMPGNRAPSEPPPSLEHRLLCMIIRQLTQELLEAIGPTAEGDNRRRMTSHVRQVAMYVCHTVFVLSMEDVAAAFGRERSTVGHACRMVEQRRDDPAYDAFVAIIERMASAVHLLAARNAA